MIRTFIAFDIEKNEKQEYFNLIQKGKVFYPKQIKWVSEENLHFTCLFVGDIEPRDKNLLINCVKNFSEKLANIHLSEGNLSWNTAQKPRIVWVDFKSNSKSFLELRRAFVADIQNRFKYIHLDDRDFKFHLTLGRVKSNEVINHGKWQMQDEVYSRNIILKQISLYQSILTPQGPIYKNLALFPLKGGELNG